MGLPRPTDPTHSTEVFLGVQMMLKVPQSVWTLMQMPENSQACMSAGSWADLLWVDLVVELEDVHDAVFDVL